MNYIRPYVLTVTLNPTIDKTVVIPGFKLGKDFREESHDSCIGGKGINVSRVLANFGVRTLATGFMGADHRAHVHRQLIKEKIEYDFAKVSGDIRVSLTILDPSNQKITRIIENGPTVDTKELNAFVRKYKKLIKHCRYVILSGRCIPGAPDDIYAKLISIAKNENRLVILDTSGEAYIHGLEAKPYMIKPNVEEAEEVLGHRVNSLLSLKKAVRYFHHELEISIVALTHGEKGAVVYDGNEMFHAAPPIMQMKSPVGCGDSFIAGFVTAQLMNYSFAECVRMAVACGSANVKSVTPGGINKAMVNSIIKKVTIESIEG